MMFTKTLLGENESLNYDLMIENLKGYLDQDLPHVSNLANMAAVIRYFFDDVSWVGFYLYQDGKLILGPFQGLPACTQIALGKGVCGLAGKTRETIVVDDVSKFSGHIACDAASQSEIVVPILKNNELFGVLDLDSSSLSRFGKAEKEILEKAVALLIDIL
jgi:GAF domain-containing protein